MTSFDWQLNKTKNYRTLGRNWQGVRLLLLTFNCIGLFGCASLPLADRPEFNSAQWSPASVDHAWMPPPADRASFASDTRAAAGVSDSAAVMIAGQTCDLPALIN